MTTIDVTPRPAAAPPARRAWRQGLLETSLMLRNGEQLLLALVIPVGLLVAGFLVGPRLDVSTDALVGSVLGLAVWSTAFTSTAVATGFDRRQGVLERLAATPLGRSGLVIGKVIAVVIVIGLQWLVLLAVSLALGWRPALTAALPLALVAAVVAAVAFVGLALAMAGTLRAEATLALANLVYLVGLVAGIVVPASSMGSASTVVRLLPTGALGEAMRAWSTAGTGSAAGLGSWWPLLVLTCWALAAGLLARKVFRWMA